MQKKMKILFITHSFYPNIGGIEIHSEILATSFYNAGHSVSLLTWSTDETERCFPYTVIRKPNLKKLREVHAWAEVIFENNPCMRLSWPVFFSQKPLIIVLHTWLTRSNGRLGLQDIIKYKWLKRANVVISCSDSIRKRCWPESIVITNPYNDELFKLIYSINKSIDFAFLGRLVSDKGADIAIKAIYKLKYLIKDKGLFDKQLLLTIIGEGPERKYLEDLVAALLLENNVIFTGALRGKELVECLNKHHYLIVPSRWKEPFGMVALEGMACGCIPIVSDGGGLPEAIGNAGLVFARGDVNALVSTLCKVKKDIDLVNKLRDAATTHILNYHQDIITSKYLKVVEEVVAI